MTKEVASGAALGQTQEGYSDAIKNRAGVQPTNSSGSSNDAFAIRGIKLNLFSNYRLDGGLPVTSVITNLTENKDRVETLKGANALMFGVASPACIINFVTKRAGQRDVTSVGMAGSSFGQYGISADIGRRFMVVGVTQQLEGGAARHFRRRGQRIGRTLGIHRCRACEERGLVDRPFARVFQRLAQALQLDDGSAQVTLSLRAPPAAGQSFNAAGLDFATLDLRPSAAAAAPGTLPLVALGFAGLLGAGGAAVCPALTEALPPTARGVQPLTAGRR